MRIEYITKLIAGVRESIKEDMPNWPRTEEYSSVLVSKWLDVVLLCDVVEEDLEHIKDIIELANSKSVLKRKEIQKQENVG